MTAWYDKAIFYHMYPLGMTGAPFANPYPVSDGTADGTRDISSENWRRRWICRSCTRKQPRFTAKNTAARPSTRWSS